MIDQNKLIFLPGWRFNSTIFSEIASSFSNYQLVDYPLLEIDHFDNVFESVAAKISQMLYSINDPMILVGWSLGGLFAISLALKLQIKVKAVVLLGSSPFFSEDKKTGWTGISPLQKEKFYYLYQNKKNKLYQKFIDLIGYPSVDETMRLFLVKHLNQKADQVWDFLLDTLFSCDLRASYQKLQCPILSISGKKDGIVTVNQSMLYHLNPLTKIINLEHSGHIPFITDKEKVISLIHGLI